MVIFVKKHKSGHSLSTMATPGFAENFMGSHAAKRTEHCKAITQLVMAEFKGILTVFSLLENLEN